MLHHKWHGQCITLKITILVPRQIIPCQQINIPSIPARGEPVEPLRALESFDKLRTSGQHIELSSDIINIEWYYKLQNTNITISVMNNPCPQTRDTA